MHQSLHICAKDIRYLRYDLLLLLALDVIFGWMSVKHIDSTWVQTLLPIAASFVIVRLIHAEPIPGDTQFWITRPCRWGSLAAAKGLFILAFIVLPIFVVQFMILIVERFPLAETLPGLLWAQVVMTFGVWFPIAALAAMTSGLASFVFSLLIVFTVAFSTQQSLAIATMMFGWHYNTAVWPPRVEWLRFTIVIGAFMFIAVTVLYLQYRRRQTGRSRIFAIATAVAALLAYVLMPWQAAMALETHMSKHPGAADSLRIVRSEAPRRAVTPDVVNGKIALEVSFKIDGLPAGTDVVDEGLDAQVHTTAAGKESSIAATATQNYVRIPLDFYKTHRDEPAVIRGRIYLTLLGNTRSQTIPFRKEHVNTLDGLQCYNGDRFNHVYCRAAFRWPNEMVYVKSALDNPLYTLISYSPFPSGISIDDAIEAHWADGPSASDTVTIVTKEPLAHLHRDFEFRSAHLSDFSIRR